MSKEGVSFKNRDRFIQLGIAISTLRKLRGMSQDQLAEKANMSRSHLSAIEAPILIAVGNAAVLGHLAQRRTVKQDTKPASVSPIRVKSFSGKDDCCLSEVTVLFFCADTHITPPVCKKIRPEQSCSDLQIQALRPAPFLK